MNKWGGGGLTKYAEAYVAYLAHFHGTRDYFECHELLEELWKQESSPELRTIWHGLIQVAVSLYHERRGNQSGAVQMMEQALLRLSAAELPLAGLNRETLVPVLNERLTRLKNPAEQEVYRDLILPVEDKGLLDAAVQLSADWGYQWGRPSPMLEDALIHRHTRRDRTEVIAERLKRLAAKASGRPRQTERED
jgi:uncharacterized protein